MISIISKVKEKINQKKEIVEKQLEKQKNIQKEQLDLYNNITNLKKDIDHTRSLKSKANKYENIINMLKKVDMKEFKKNIRLHSHLNKSILYRETDFGLWFTDTSLEQFASKVIEDISKNKETNLFLLKKAEDFEKEIIDIPHNNIKITDCNIKRKYLKDLDEIKIAKIGKNFNKEKLYKYVVIDVETTGLKASQDEIIEISAIKYIDFEPVECFTTLVKPKKPIPVDATNINNITNDMVKDYPSLNQIMSSFDDFIKGFDIVGYNVIFDLKFLYCSGSNILNQQKIKIYDCYELAKKVYKDDLVDCKLETIGKERFKLYLDTSHRSLTDCALTNKVFKDCIEEIIT